MTFASSRNRLFRTAGALVLGLSLIATPVVAGNGNGNGTGGGNAGSNAGGNKAGNASNKSSSAGSSKSAAATGKNTQGVTARSYGKLNEDVFSISGRGTVATGRAERGVIPTG